MERLTGLAHMIGDLLQWFANVQIRILAVGNVPSMLVKLLSAGRQYEAAEVRLLDLSCVSLNASDQACEGGVS